MERDGFFTGAPNPAVPAEMNCGPSDHLLQPCYLNLNWDHPMEQSSHFESALSSIVSSPSNPSVAATGAENVVIRELIGRLGSICNSVEISPQPHQYLNGGSGSATASCYNTPLGSPSKFNIFALGNAPASGNEMAAQMDLGFTERATRLSSFYGGLPGQFELPEVASRVSSNQSLVGGGPQVMTQERSQVEVSMRPKSDAGLSNSSALDNGEESSVSNHAMANREVGSQVAGESGGRKRKAPQRGKAKDSVLCSATKEVPKVEANGISVKRTKSSEDMGTGKDEVKPKIEQCSGSDIADGDRKPGKENKPKPPEPPKLDYIHVRARRGQATDSHSLAERVRREKISERMKFLQDLVPGCNKVTGKAVMLDEIINYVQSLQRQVEFLSMKLATVNPTLDFNMDDLLQKDSHRPLGLLSHESLPVEMPGPVFPFAQQSSQGSLVQSIMSSGMENLCSVNPSDASLRTAFNLHLPRLDGFADGSSQVGNYWDDGLQHVVQMGFGQNQEAAAFSSQPEPMPFHDAAISNSNMKVEL